MKSLRNLVFLVLAAMVPLSVAAQADTVTGGGRDVSVFVDGDRIDVNTGADDVSALLSDLGVQVSEGDRISPAGETALQSGDIVTVEHKQFLSQSRKAPDASPQPLMEAVQREAAQDSRAKAELAQKRAATADQRAAARAAAERQATDAAKRAKLAPEFELLTKERKLPFTRKWVADRTMLKGKKKVAVSGRNGLATETFKVKRKAGTIVASAFVSRAVAYKPTTEVILYGTKPKYTASRGSAGHKVKKRMTMRASAYWSGFGSGITATGRRAGRGVIAVDPRVIPLGTRVYIKGYGYAIAADTGGAIKGDRIDICFKTRREAINFGRQTVVVEIVK